MNESETMTAEHLVLDPFDFHGNPSSCIAGLGGAMPNPDPTYAFHTHYVPVQRGHAHFTIEFSGLRARRGTLWLRVHMLPTEPGATARLVTGDRIQINRLAQHGGRTSLRFEAFRGASYALMGVVMDETDASADGVQIILDRPHDGSASTDESDLQIARSSRFGTDALRPTAQLLTLSLPSFSSPVSQVYTPAQMRDQAFRRWSKQLVDTSSDALSIWRVAYVLQTLERYGMLRPGVRALGIGAAAATLLPIVTQAGVSCEIAETIDVDEIGRLSGFDCIWSLGLTDQLTPAQVALFIESTMESIRPAGLAIHVLDISLGSRLIPGDMPHFDRPVVERLALNLISRGHDVARLNFALGAPGSQSDKELLPFGMIARRARSVL